MQQYLISSLVKSRNILHVVKQITFNKNDRIPLQVIKQSCSIKITGANVSNLIDIKKYRTDDLVQSLDSLSVVLKSVKCVSLNVDKFITPDRIGVIKFNSVGSKINVVSIETIEKLFLALKEFNESADVDIIVLRSANPNSFFAGADLNIFDTLSVEDAALSGRTLQKLNRFIQDCCKPTVSIVEGVCFGGGLEIAMASTFCAALDAPKVRFAFPEVTLGMIPGGLGTYLSFTKCAHIPMLDMLLTGKSIDVQKALKFGMISHILSTNDKVSQFYPQSESDILKTLNINLEQAKIIQKKSQLHINQSMLELLWKPNNLGSSLKKTYITHFLTGKFIIPALMTHNNTLKKTQEDLPVRKNILSLYTTFLKCSSDLEKFSDYYINTEAKTFGTLISSPESKALREIFFQQKRISYFLPKVSTKKIIKNLSIIGYGHMGQGITEVSLNKTNFNVVVKDVSEEVISKALSSVEKSFESKVTSKRMTSSEATPHINKFKITRNYTDLENSDIVIEAVPELLKLKQQILKELEQIISPSCIIASNTFAIPISEIAKYSSRPQNVIGMNYFSPDPIMKLLEIVMTDKTSPETLAIALKVGQQQEKICIVVKDSPGFITTRILTSVIAECADLIDDGYSPELIDKEFKEFGFPTGAFRLMDSIGVDNIFHIIEFLSKKLGPRFNVMRDNIYSHLNSSGALGRKVNIGFYCYDDCKSPGMSNLHSKEFSDYIKIHNNFIELTPSFADVMPRILARFSNEICKCLEEGIIVSPQVGDIASVFGIGFPAIHKGPFAYIDKITPEAIIANLKKYENKRNTAAFQPCNLLLDMAKNKTKFYPSP